MENESIWMKKALELAEQGRGTTSPNPLVGAVVVANGKEVGSGWHRRAGEDHAEVWALREAGENARGATLYVTLEPCAHFGKTPPCVDMIIKSGIRRVVCACTDPFPRVNGSGIIALRNAGIEVEIGLCATEAKELNRGFFLAVTKKRPWICGKLAMSLDGKTTTVNGESKWLTGELARRDSHILRSVADAVGVGIGTVLADNPQLTIRAIETQHQPLRVIWDRYARTSLDAKLVNEKEAQTLLFCSEQASCEKIQALRDKGTLVEVIPEHDETLDLRVAANLLAEKYDVRYLLIEGGATLLGGFLQENLLDEIITYIAPLALGGKSAKGAIDGKGIELLTDAVPYKIRAVEPIGSDLKVIYWRR